MPHGRGGAGDIYAVEQKNARKLADLEANLQAVGSYSKEPLPSDRLNREERQYARTGRGGMGNYHSLKTLSVSRHLKDVHRSDIRAGGSQAPLEGDGRYPCNKAPSYTVRRATSEQNKTYGRGGAGNFAFGANDGDEGAARQRKEEEQKRERLKQNVEQCVKETLTIPQKAKLPGIQPC